MSSHGPNPGTHQENLSRHQELKTLLSRIDAALEHRSCSVDEISDMIAQLGDRLIRHFAFEEDGGYFGDALSQAPQLISKANALLAQHPRIRIQADHLASDLRLSDAGSTEWWTRTTQLFRALRDELAHHEQQENVLLQEAYQQDLGTTD